MASIVKDWIVPALIAGATAGAVAVGGVATLRPATVASAGAPDPAVCKAIEDRAALIDSGPRGDQLLIMTQAFMAERLHARLGCDPTSLAQTFASHPAPTRPTAAPGGSFGGR